MRPVAFAFVVTLFLGACASAAQQASTPAPLQLAGTRWRFTKIEGHDVPAAVRATLVFESNGHVSGRAGCNGYGGPWAADNGTLQFGGMLSTKMACLEPAGAMQVEHDVFDALRGTARARLENRQLILLDAGGVKLATLDAQGGSQ